MCSFSVCCDLLRDVCHTAVTCCNDALESHLHVIVGTLIPLAMDQPEIHEQVVSSCCLFLICWLFTSCSLSLKLMFIFNSLFLCFVDFDLKKYLECNTIPLIFQIKRCHYIWYFFFNKYCVLYLIPTALNGDWDVCIIIAEITVSLAF